VDGTIQSILDEFGLPLTAILVYVVLKHKFGFFGTSGSLVVFAGSLVAMLPIVISSFGHGGDHNVLDSPFWVIVYAISLLPLSIIAVHQEIFFKGSLWATLPRRPS